MPEQRRNRFKPFFLSASAARAACQPGMPQTPPPAWVAGAAVVEPRDRCAVVGVAGRGPHVEQLLKRQLAVEDVAADEAVLLLHLVRTDDVAVQ